MYLTGYIERMGTGTGDIIRKCMEAELKAPEFIQEEDFKVVIWRTDQATDQAAVDRKIIELIRLIDKPSKSSDLQLQLGSQNQEEKQSKLLKINRLQEFLFSDKSLKTAD